MRCCFYLCKPSSADWMRSRGGGDPDSPVSRNLPPFPPLLQVGCFHVATVTLAGFFDPRLAAWTHSRSAKSQGKKLPAAFLWLRAPKQTSGRASIVIATVQTNFIPCTHRTLLFFVQETLFV